MLNELNEKFANFLTPQIAQTSMSANFENLFNEAQNSNLFSGISFDLNVRTVFGHSRDENKNPNFSFVQGHVFYCHQIILSLRSGVFDLLYYLKEGYIKNTYNSETSTYIISDASIAKKKFRSLLLYIYTAREDYRQECVDLIVMIKNSPYIAAEPLNISIARAIDNLAYVFLSIYIITN